MMETKISSKKNKAGIATVKTIDNKSALLATMNEIASGRKVKKSAEQLLKEVHNPKMDREIAKIEQANDPVIKLAEENILMKRNSFDLGIKFAKRIEKELGCGLKEIEGLQNTREYVVSYKGRNIAQVSPRAQCAFGGYRHWMTPKPFRVTTDEEIEHLYDSFVDRCAELDKAPVKEKKTKTPKTPKTPKAKKVVEAPKIEDIEKRIKGLSKKSNAIHLKTVTPEVKEWAESQGYKFVDDGLTLVVRAL